MTCSNANHGDAPHGGANHGDAPPGAPGEAGPGRARPGHQGGRHGASGRRRGSDLPGPAGDTPGRSRRRPRPRTPTSSASPCCPEPTCRSPEQAAGRDQRAAGAGVARWLSAARSRPATPTALRRLGVAGGLPRGHTAARVVDGLLSLAARGRRSVTRERSERRSEPGAHSATARAPVSGPADRRSAGGHHRPGQPVSPPTRASRSPRSTPRTTWQADRPWRTGWACRASRRSPAVPMPPCTGAAVDHAPVRRLRLRGGDQRPLPLPARPGADRAVGRVRPAHTARLRLRP